MPKVPLTFDALMKNGGQVRDSLDAVDKMYNKLKKEKSEMLKKEQDLKKYGSNVNLLRDMTLTNFDLGSEGTKKSDID